MSLQRKSSTILNPDPWHNYRLARNQPPHGGTMFVRDFMTKKPISLSPDDNLPLAINVSRKNHIRHLPVVDEYGKLVGIVVEKDLLSNQPSPATTLSVYEIYALLESLRIRQIMSRPVITVTGDCPIEEAARIMVENKISCLPVMDGEKLVGIITETDVFKVLVEVLGGHEDGFRFTLRMPEKVGALSAASGAIAEAGGNIVAVTSTGVRDGQREVMIKETGADRSQLSELIEKSGVEIIDMRSSSRFQPILFGKPG
jgi:acetoin utilization protein AcuB